MLDDGTVHLYQWDTTDPVLKTWSKAYPGTVEPKSAISPALLAHIRYPEDLFNVQRDVLSTYHVDSASAFYGGQDFWRIPSDPSSLVQMPLPNHRTTRRCSCLELRAQHSHYQRASFQRVVVRISLLSQ
jgi:uncharacterized membrane protein (UPF0182 family)